MRSAVLLIVVLSSLGLGCRPTLDDRPWLVTKLMIVGVKADPPEVAPGGALSAEVIAIAPTAPLDTSTTSWTFCHEPKPLGENRVVTPDCLAAGTTDATGSPAHLIVPTDACQLFGPNVPQPDPGAPPTRPRDPDPTGGYFQPITAALGGSLAVALERVGCGLPDASLATARAFQAAYRPNQNPTVASLTLSVDGALVTAAVAAGARVTAEVRWTAGDAEAFPLFDRTANALTQTRETLSASWYVTDGELDRGAAEVDDPVIVSTTTTWTVPEGPVTLEILVVLRDSRGGMDFARATVAVQ